MPLESVSRELPLASERLASVCSHQDNPNQGRYLLFLDALPLCCTHSQLLCSSWQSRTVVVCSLHSEITKSSVKIKAKFFYDSFQLHNTGGQCVLNYFPGVGDIELDSNALKILKSVSLISYMILVMLTKTSK